MKNLEQEKKKIKKKKRNAFEIVNALYEVRALEYFQ